MSTCDVAVMLVEAYLQGHGCMVPDENVVVLQQPTETMIPI